MHNLKKSPQQQVVANPRRSLCLLFLFLLSACQPAPEPAPTQSPQAPAPTRTSAPLLPTPAPAETLIAPRAEPITYTVQPGDTLSSIAAQFDLVPQTLLWANYDQLFDNPDLLLPGMALLVLPVDGVYHQVGGSDTLLNVAAFFAADPQAVLDWPANQLDAQAPVLFAGQWLMVPAGQRASRWRQMPNIPRQNAAISYEEFGSGACEEDFSAGPQDDGQYAWPLAQIAILGESFAEWHPGLDLAVNPGEWVRAAGDGVVVFSGWSNLGYGLMLMLDHGNGDYSLYSGLAAVLAACGRAVQQGGVIAEAGHTGYPAGPILHFELRRGSEFLDPFEILPAP